MTINLFWVIAKKTQQSKQDLLNFEEAFVGGKVDRAVEGGEGGELGGLGCSGKGTRRNILL